MKTKKMTQKEIKELYGYYKTFRTRKHFSDILEFADFKTDIEKTPTEESRDLLNAFRGIFDFQVTTETFVKEIK